MSPPTERDRWTDWLVSIGFGIDFSTEQPPPCTADEYAEAWHRADPSEPAETWAWSVEEETGQRFGGM